MRDSISALLREGRLDDALQALQAARAAAPDDSAIQAELRVVRERMLRKALEQIGSLDAVPTRRRPPSFAPSADEEHVLARIDGARSVDELLDGSTLGRHRTMQALSRLLGDGAIGLLSPAPTAPAQRAPASGAARCAVVADQNGTQAALTRTMLRLALGGGVRIETVGAAPELVRAVETHRRELLVVEFALPGADGLAALRSVRRAVGVVPSVIVAQKVEREFVTARAPEGAVVLARPIEKGALFAALATLGIESARQRL